MKNTLPWLCAALLCAAGCDDDSTGGPADDADGGATDDAEPRALVDAAPPDAGCTAEAEICNGVDDDCDDEIDEGYPGLGAECRVMEGACVNIGAFACSEAGDEVVCDAAPPVPVDETCNEADDDCDGNTDEGFPLDRDPNNCGACGNACSFDNGFADCVEATCQLGGCEPGFGDANGIAGDGCECTLANEGVELCDGVDDDCDMEVDEDFALGEPCAAGVGQCRAEGVTVCGEAGDVVCGADPGAPADEACNGLDDDCDGAVDEGFDADGDGAPFCPELDCEAPCPEGLDCALLCARQDCDDANPNRHPQAVDLCEDGVDQNCDELDAPCATPAGRVNTMAIARMDMACRDFDGDGEPDNAFEPLALLSNGQLQASIDEMQLNLIGIALGVVPPLADQRFDFGIVVGLPAGEGAYQITDDSLDDEGIPLMIFPGARVVEGEFQAGPGDFLLGLPVPGGQPGSLRVRNTLAQGRLAVDDAGLTIEAGVLTGIVTQEDLDEALRALPPELAPIAMLLEPDIDLDDEPGPDAYSACIRYTVTPVDLLGFLAP